jgi:nucleotide-binding universal stress UspA family protein
VSADIAQPAGLNGVVSIRRVVVATDLSESSTGALRLGSQIARVFDAELLIVHVLPDLDLGGSVKDTLGMEPGDLLERRAGEAEARLRRLESLVGRGHVHATVRSGSAAAEIVRLATESAADLIVLGSHGLRAPREAGAKPVAERVRQRARCPVIVALPSRGGDASRSGIEAPSIHGVLVATDLTARSDARRRRPRGR